MKVFPPPKKKVLVRSGQGIPEKIVGLLYNPKSDLVTVKCELKNLMTRLQKDDLNTGIERYATRGD